MLQLFNSTINTRKCNRHISAIIPTLLFLLVIISCLLHNNYKGVEGTDDLAPTASVKCPTNFPTTSACSCESDFFPDRLTGNGSSFYVHCVHVKDISDLAEVFDSFTNLPTSRAVIDLTIQSSKFDRLTDILHPLAEKLKGKTKLNSLNLVYSHFKDIPADTFKPFADTLNTLVFYESQYTPGQFNRNEIYDALKPLRNLESLELNFPDMTEFDASVFKNLPKLKSLSLALDAKEFKNEDTFKTLVNLTHVSLQTKLHYIPFSILTRPKLENLYFRSPSLRYLGANTFQKSLNLTDLEVCYSKLDEIEEGTFDALKSMRRLYLTDNHLTKLPPLCPPVNNLTQIHLSENMITELTRATFSKCKNLTMLVLDSNHLTDIPANLWLDSIGTLQTVSVHNNKIENFPWSLIISLPDLVRFSAGHNRITSFKPSRPLTTRKLETFELFFNKLREFDVEALADSEKSIQEIYVHHNLLTRFDFEKLARYSNLTRVDVYSNQIESLTGMAELATISPGIVSTITLKNNPIKCDCETLKLLKWYHIDSLLDADEFPQNLVDLACTFSQDLQKDISRRTNRTKFSVLDGNLVKLLEPHCPDIQIPADFKPILLGDNTSSEVNEQGNGAPHSLHRLIHLYRTLLACMTVLATIAVCVLVAFLLNRYGLFRIPTRFRDACNTFFAPVTPKRYAMNTIWKNGTSDRIKFVLDQELNSNGVGPPAPSSPSSFRNPHFPSSQAQKGVTSQPNV